jgi:hypothetical protein
MSLYDKASLVQIPSGYKGGSPNGTLYSVLPANGNGDFTHTRASSATRVNKDGLIESVASGVPRLDYPLLDGVVQSCPALLLEPSRTNLSLRSEEFDDTAWSKVRCTIIENQISSPDGNTTADLLTSTDTSENYCQSNASITVSGSKQVGSWFVKKGTSDFCHILLWDTSSNGARQWFDLTNGSVGTSTTFGSSVSVDSAEMIDYGNGWYRCIVVFNNSNTTVRYRISASNSNGSTSSTSGKTIYIWGSQLEVGSYATSYIPTTSSTVSRSKDECNGAGTLSTFNSEQGVVFLEIKPIALDGTHKRITLSDGTSTNRIIMGIDNSNNVLGTVFDGSNQAVLGGNYTGKDNVQKVALKYKVNDFSLYFNGFEVATDTSGNTFSANTLNQFRFEDGDGGLEFFGTIKQAMTFNEALTDSELEQITSWRSFDEMAKGQLYTVY